MGRQRSVGEVGLPQVMTQSALSVKNPPDQSKIQIQTKQRPVRAPRNRWKKPIVENVSFPPPHEPWDKEDWEKIRKCRSTGNQQENHYLHNDGGGELGEVQSQPESPTEPSKVQPQHHRRLHCRRGSKKSSFKWRKRKVVVVEQNLLLPPVCEHKHVEHEDWDQELSEQASGDQDDNHKRPFNIEDVLTMALMKLSVEQDKNGHMACLYNPSVHHMPPVNWECDSGTTMEGQFSDAEE